MDGVQLATVLQVVLCAGHVSVCVCGCTWGRGDVCVWGQPRVCPGAPGPRGEAGEHCTEAPGGDVGPGAEDPLCAQRERAARRPSHDIPQARGRDWYGAGAGGWGSKTMAQGGIRVGRGCVAGPQTGG